MHLGVTTDRENLCDEIFHDILRNDIADLSGRVALAQIAECENHGWLPFGITAAKHFCKCRMCWHVWLIAVKIISQRICKKLRCDMWTFEIILV